MSLIVKAVQPSMRVLKVEGEPTTYKVESGTLECVNNTKCKKMFNKREKKWRDLRVGDPCPECAKHGDPAGVLDVRFHTVDIAAYNKNGACSCEFFSFNLQPKVCRLRPEEQAMGRHRCAHIDHARDFALDVSLAAHDRAEHAGSRGQREEDAA